MSKVNQKIFLVPVGVIECLATLGAPLQRKRITHYLTEGNNKTYARLSLTKSPHFWKNYNAVSKEERKKLQPFTLLRKGKIEEILSCNKRHKNKHEDYTCGIPINEIPTEKRDELTDSNEEFGMCCIEGCDPFPSSDCPYYIE